MKNDTGKNYQTMKVFDCQWDPGMPEDVRITGGKMKKKKEEPISLQTMLGRLRDPRGFYYGAAEYDYDSYKACQNGSSCCDHDYCRCGVITNAHIKSVNINYVIDLMTKDCQDELLCYCVDRVMRISKVMDVNSWKINISGGYYGEEVHGVSLIEEAEKDTSNMLVELDKLTNIDKIKKLLEYEYGWVLPKLKSLTRVKISEIPLEDINLFNDSYVRKLSKESIDYYKDYKLPRAVCILAADHSNIVIDGYHRMMSAQKNKLATVKIIELV